MLITYNIQHVTMNKGLSLNIYHTERCDNKLKCNQLLNDTIVLCNYQLSWQGHCFSGWLDPVMVLHCSTDQLLYPQGWKNLCFKYCVGKLFTWSMLYWCVFLLSIRCCPLVIVRIYCQWAWSNHEQKRYIFLLLGATEDFSII
jgi:hypothetical protein